MSRTLNNVDTRGEHDNGNEAVSRATVPDESEDDEPEAMYA
jgi:hypothetical protein